VRCVPGDVGVLTVVLSTPWAIALERAVQDPDRGISKDPDFLRQDHARFERSRAELACDLALDGAGASPATLAQRVLDALDRRRARPRRPDGTH
jgi:hypothetical protein